MKRTILLATILILLLAGCAVNRPPAGQSWLLASLVVNGTVFDLTSTNPINLEISAKDQVGGSSGCNAYFGELTFKDDGKVVPSNFGNTVMACERGMDRRSSLSGAPSAGSMPMTIAIPNWF